MVGNNHYDLICSLGGNCAAAHNLRYRKMRTFSLPLDWVYMEDEKTMWYLAHAFKSHFADFFLRENLRKIPGSQTHAIIYQDLTSGYFFPNHFQEDLENNSTEYLKVKTKLDRRILRLYKKIETSKKVLFILSTTFEHSIDPILELQKTLKQMFPLVIFDFRVMQFSANNTAEQKINENISWLKYTRKMHLYDFSQTTPEWDFLDNLTIQGRGMDSKKIKIFSGHLGHFRFCLNLSWENKK